MDKDLSEQYNQCDFADTDGKLYKQLVETDKNFAVNFSILMAEGLGYDKLMDLLERTGDLKEGVEIVRKLADRILRSSMKEVEITQESYFEKLIKALGETIERQRAKERNQVKQEGDGRSLDEIFSDMENPEIIEPIFAWKVGLDALKDYIKRKEGLVDESLERKILELIGKLSGFLKEKSTYHTRTHYLDEDDNNEYIKNWFKEDFWPTTIQKAFNDVIKKHIE